MDLWHDKYLEFTLLLCLHGPPNSQYFLKCWQIQKMGVWFYSKFLISLLENAIKWHFWRVVKKSLYSNELTAISALYKSQRFLCKASPISDLHIHLLNSHFHLRWTFVAFPFLNSKVYSWRKNPLIGILLLNIA